jgi:hypothetical protein
MLYSPAPADTAAHWLRGKPLTAYINRSNATVYDAVLGCKSTGWFGKQDSCDVAAVHFYLLNHAAAVIAQRRDPLEPLTPEELAVLKMYVDVATPIAARLFYYMLFITTREARHNKSSVSSKLSAVHKEVSKDYPGIDVSLVEKMFDFTTSAPDASGILNHMLVGQTKEFPLGAYTRTVAAVFYKCSWSSAFGGPKWGNIADALHAFSSGQWSAEMLADTAFTLAHNGGPMFNKGMLFSHHGGNFMTILDMQRAGVVPLWLEKEGSGFHDNVYSTVKKSLPEIFEGELDYAKVKSLGALGDYSKKASMVKPKMPVGCLDKQIVVDHQTSVFVLANRAKA